jgi:hypothetical protein
MRAADQPPLLMSNDSTRRDRLKNVTWWVQAAATMTTSTFQGNILAAAGITLSYGTFHGNAWAQADVAKTVTKAGS